MTAKELNIHTCSECGDKLRNKNNNLCPRCFERVMADLAKEDSEVFDS
jgi:predicted amidophosphoribosyltransferase